MRKTLRKTTLALVFLGSAASFTGPSFALESGVETSAWPELTPRADLPNFQLDGTDEDQTIVDISPEGKPVFAEPDNRDPSTPHVVIMPND